jgi:hypothetical protein
LVDYGKFDKVDKLISKRRNNIWKFVWGDKLISGVTNNIYDVRSEVRSTTSVN